MKLHQVAAILSERKQRIDYDLAKAKKALEAGGLLQGFSKTYQPKDEEGEQLPPDGKKIQVKVADVLKQVTTSLSDFINLTAMQDQGNTAAKGSITLDGKVLIADVPVTNLLFLDKTLAAFEAVVRKIPTLDPAVDWKYSEEAGCHKADPEVTTRSKKVPFNHILYKHTPEHPAQVEIMTKDEIVGHYTTVRFSAEIPYDEKEAILKRCRQLRDAIKLAREEANTIEVKRTDFGKPIFEFLIGNSTGSGSS